MIRAVIDINLFVSGIFWRGSPRDVYLAAGEQAFVPLLSNELVAELYDVVSRDKFSELRRRLGRTPEELLEGILDIADIVTPIDAPINVVRDPDDADVLACAVGGKADYIVSGDKDLLVLETYQSIPILTANQFLEVLAQDENER